MAQMRLERASNATARPVRSSLKHCIRRALQTGGVIAFSVGVSGVAGAQQASSGLEEIIVTATRQSEEINRVALSIQAVTQEHLDMQGIKTTADLVRAVPGLNSVQALGGSQQTFSIRGIVGATGAATTGTYLDDTNLAKRSNGGIAQNNGVVVPLLFDLERVEVLKGPQGTLYGGSSQGGTIRYITGAPSLTEFSGKARAELSSMGQRSEVSNEFAAAFGGPIIEDKLGFRVSAIRRETGGWVDVYSGYTGGLIQEDANSNTEWAARAALLWKVTDSFSAQLSGYHADYETEGGPGSETALFVRNAATGQMERAPANQTFTTTQRCISANQRTTALADPTPGTPGATAFVPSNSAATGAAGTTCPGGTIFVRPQYTYGPFKTGQDISIATGRQEIVGQTSELDVEALTLDFDFGPVSLKSITSYLRDETNADGGGGEAWTATTGVAPPGQAGQWTTNDPTHRGFPMFQPWFQQTGTGNTGHFLSSNKRDGIEQEFRVSSNTDGRLSWVAGAYYSDLETKIKYRWPVDPALGDLAFRLLYGDMGGPGANTSDSAAYYGVINTEGFQSYGDTTINEKESAVFAEANFWIIPDKLKAIGGLRYSKVDLEYTSLNHGQLNGRLPTSLGSLVEGDSSDKPITPKAGLQYQITDDKMVYATGAKGFRAGGVNPAISPAFCATALNQLGLTAEQIPSGFDPDTVWSYELGGKFRLFDVVQVNMAAYRIDWKEIQATTTLSCGQGFTTSGGDARSEGGELSVQYRPIRALNLYVNASYTDAYYIDPVVGANRLPNPTPSFNAGDKFDIPPFAMSAGAQYDFAMGSLESFVRLDGTYQNSYVAGASFGASGYGTNYFTQNNPSRQQLNLRAGFKMENGFDVNLFVQNLLNEDKLIAGFGDGRGQCAASSATCSTYTTFSPFVAQSYQTPRKIGVQVNYRFGASKK